MLKNITVVSVDVEVKMNKNNKPYDMYEVAYKDDAGKLQSKKLLAFAIKSGGDLIKTATKGTELTIGMEKNDAGYWDWLSVAPLGTAPAAVAASPMSSPTQASSEGKKAAYTTNGNRDWETKEERQARQVMIVRQSSLSNAIALLKTEKVLPSTEEVIKVAKAFEVFVLGMESVVVEKAKTVAKAVEAPAPVEAAVEEDIDF
jgi:hypothetical protein